MFTDFRQASTVRDLMVGVGQRLCPPPQRAAVTFISAANDHLRKHISSGDIGSGIATLRPAVVTPSCPSLALPLP